MQFVRMDGFVGKTSRWLWFDISMVAVNYFMTLAQIKVFMEKSQFVAAALFLIITVRVMVIQLRMGSPAEIQLHIRQTLSAGFMKPKLQVWLRCIPTMKSSFLALIAPLAMLQCSSLSSTEVAIAVCNFALSVKSLGDEDYKTHLGVELYQFGEAVVSQEARGPMILMGLKLICYLNIISEVACFTMVAYICGPSVAVMVLCPRAVALLHANRNAVVQGEPLDWKTWLCMPLLEPLNLITFPHCSFLSVVQYSLVASTEYGPLPAHNHCAAYAVHKLLCFLVVLADLQTSIMNPSAEFSEKGVASVVYASCLEVLGTIAAAVCIAFVSFMCACNSNWFNGVENGSRIQRMRALLQDVYQLEADAGFTDR